MTKVLDEGEEMHAWVRDLFPIARSITGQGVRDTIAYIKRILPELQVHAVPSGTIAFDWTVPDEWTIRDAWIEDESGQRIVSFAENNLHVVGYSTAVDTWMELDELQSHLHSRPDLPDAIPYVTSYYERCWGFCLAHSQREELQRGRYHVLIDADIHPGVLNFAEVVVPGHSSKEVFISTYICHPSMANNELSGPVVATALARWLLRLPDRKYTYRIVFVPETIGSLVYLSRNLDHLRSEVIAGFNVTCVGDDRCYSYLPSRHGGTLADRVAVHVLRHIDPAFKHYRWLDRGSDERQYCAPEIDLPVVSIMRSKYGQYPEYHTSLDNLDLVSPEGLTGSLHALRYAIRVIEGNCTPVAVCKGEPHLSRHGLYPNRSSINNNTNVHRMMDLLSYADGKHDLLEISDLLEAPFLEMYAHLQTLLKYDLITQ